MVHTAGQANTKFTKSNPHETSRAFLALKPASGKIVAE